MRKPSLLILSFPSPVRDQRVHKEWLFLHDSFDITIAAWKPRIEGVDFVEIRNHSAALREKLYSGFAMLLGNLQPFLNHFQPDWDALEKRSFDLVLCNGLFPLPLAFRIAKGAPVFWDAHEYYPREHEDSRLWNLFYRKNILKLVRRYIPMVAGMSTVSPAIAGRYEREFGKHALLIRNTPCLENALYPRTASAPIRLLYMGDPHSGVGIDVLIKMMSLLDNRFTLDLVLIAPRRELKLLREKASGDSRIHFLPPVPMREVSRFANRYDIGLALLPSVTYNSAKSLPNRLFEYIQGRLAILTGPSTEILEVVTRYRIGMVAPGFDADSLAWTLKKTPLSEINAMKQNSDRAARELCAEKEMRLLKSALDSLVSSR